MKRMIYFAPPVIALLLYILLGFTGGFGAINFGVWLWIVVMFVSALIMLKGKWYGCIGGLLVGVILVYMSTEYTGQIVNIERPLGIIFCFYYLICGIVVYRKSC